MVSEEVVEKYDREMDRRTRQNLERFAKFMARMIEKEEMLCIHKDFYYDSDKRIQSGCTVGETKEICRI